MNSAPSSSQPLPGLAFPPKRPRTKRRVAVGVLIVVAAAIGLWFAVKAMYHNYRIAAAAAARFHQQLDRGDYDAICDEASDDFRRAGARPDQLKFLQMVHDKMGSSGQMSAKGFHANWNNGRVTADEVYDTQFSLGHAEENFVWIIEDDRARLVKYHIDSANLR